jgi:molecular chaperone GrpE (heat shock protein)
LGTPRSTISSSGHHTDTSSLDRLETRSADGYETESLAVAVSAQQQQQRRRVEELEEQLAMEKEARGQLEGENEQLRRQLREQQTSDQANQRSTIELLVTEKSELESKVRSW